MPGRSLPLALLTLLLAPAVAAAPNLEQIMADPDWIGPPVEAAWLALDGKAALYRVKKPDSVLRQLRRVGLDGQGDRAVADQALAEVDGAEPVFDQARRRAAFLRNGDLFVRELDSGRLRQLTRGLDALADPRFTTDGRVLVRAGQRWLLIDASSGLATPLAELKFEPEPDSEDADDRLRATQLRLFDSLQRLREQRAETREEDRRLRSIDPSRAPAPWYLGKDRELAGSAASPDGRYLLLATQPTEREAGSVGKMPKYVTESGYTEIEDVRTRVGRNAPVGHRLELLDLATHQRIAIDLKALPGIGDDPLADLRSAKDAPEAPELRPVSLLGARWSDDGQYLAVQLRSIDNKDRWLVSLRPSRTGAAFEVQHRLTDPAWINWQFNDFGWLPDHRTLWLLSEHSGYSHLYLKPVDGRLRALTRGDWEVHAPLAQSDGSGFWFIANRSHPTEFDLYRVRVAGSAEPVRLTTLRGVESFQLSADERTALLVYSASYLPSQLAVVAASGGDVRVLTDTRTEAYKAIDWPELVIEPVPSSHQDLPIWSKLYKPAHMEPGRRYPAVLFVHGAGYIQNSHWRFPYYFREQMFHHLLVQAGFVVLDMDYRASAGYGRAWRTAIYRRMGHPELEDLVDGVDWLVAEHQVDADRIGVYGGSYGGFMALMALFREPDRFHAGAALRPVTDWRHYNHGYTSNILNSPDIDPEAHRISSPLEFAEGLRAPLLISHGMLDDNVFYQDSVLLAQRLIDLRKEDWELASYPLEPHGYVQPESWLDQYRRIYKLFVQALRPQP